jgi:hypothetical protein
VRRGVWPIGEVTDRGEGELVKGLRKMVV